MRLSPERLKQLTGKTWPRKQAAWFKQYYGVDLAMDEQGPIITEEAFKGLVSKQCGLLGIDAKPTRPQLRMVKSA